MQGYGGGGGQPGGHPAQLYPYMYAPPQPGQPNPMYGNPPGMPTYPIAPSQSSHYMNSPYVLPPGVPQSQPIIPSEGRMPRPKTVHRSVEATGGTSSEATQVRLEEEQLALRTASEPVAVQQWRWSLARSLFSWTESAFPPTGRKKRRFECVPTGRNSGFPEFPAEVLSSVHGPLLTRNVRVLGRTQRRVLDHG